MDTRAASGIAVVVLCAACPIAAPAPSDAGFVCREDADCGAGFRCDIPAGDDGGSCEEHVVVADAGAPDAGYDAGYDAGPPCGPTPALGMPFEVCSDGADNDGDQLVDEEECRFERTLEISAGASTVPAGHAFSVSLNHAALVRAGRSRADGADVQLWLVGAQPRQLHRVVDPESAWDSTSTTLWTSTAQPIADREVDLEHRLYFGAQTPGPDLSDEAQIFHIADFFDRPDAEEVGGDWVITEDGQDLALRRSALHFARTGDATNRPVVDHDFAALDKRFAIVLGFDWRRVDDADENYRVLMQLRDARAPSADAGPDLPPTDGDLYNARAGPSLVWTGVAQGAPAEETLAWENGAGLNPVGVVSGRARIEARVDVPLGRYDLFVDGALVVADATFANPLSEVDQLRLFTWQAAHEAFSTREFRYVFARELLAVEPQAVALAQTGPCQ